MNTKTDSDHGEVGEVGEVGIGSESGGSGVKGKLIPPRD